MRRNKKNDIRYFILQFTRFTLIAKWSLSKIIYTKKNLYKKSQGKKIKGYLNFKFSMVKVEKNFFFMKWSHFGEGGAVNHKTKFP